MLVDNHGRIIQYLRIAVTDRCNLRCLYCMPEHVEYAPREEIMHYEELLRALQILVPMGIRKLRITGGEPFVRRDMPAFLEEIRRQFPDLAIHITTNGVLTEKHIPLLKRINISSVNLSLDTLDPERFFIITRRNVLPKVMASLEALLDANIPTKVNMVVMGGRNSEDILPMAELAEKHPVEVRFIEEMPFNGMEENGSSGLWNHLDILQTLESRYPAIKKEQSRHGATADVYHIPGFKGRLGIIPAFSRTFCGTCDRLRITPLGLLKTCLYDDGVFNIKDLMRAGLNDEELKQHLIKAIGNRAKDGFEAERRRTGHQFFESMSTIGG